MFKWYVIDGKGEVVRDDWMIDQCGRLYSITDGWGCEGGGGSSPADPSYRIVLGGEPSNLPFVDPRKIAEKNNPYEKAWKCSCGKKFKTYQGMVNHASQLGHDYKELEE